ncbi:MAG: CinA family protein [Oscillospiraceae bacterium]|nr:CinA family protein [Oscillospiraceae bacterium]
MDELAGKVITALRGKTLATAESCTGGMIGSALTSVAGSSAVYKGGVISYVNEIKQKLLNVPADLLENRGAVSKEVAEAMAVGVKTALNADIAVSVTGLAGPGGDDFGNPVGTVFIGYCDEKTCMSLEYHFAGDRNAVREQAAKAAFGLILEHNR